MSLLKTAMATVIDPDELSADLPVQLTEYTDDLPQMDDFKSIVLQQIPLLDVRAQIEFSLGAFETAQNIPLMTDQERHNIGLCYQQKGHNAAVELGHRLVNENARAPRIKAWCTFIDAHPGALLYCFRGGQRSKISQQWLADNGYPITRLKGGYKAFRRFLIDFLDQIPTLFLEKNIQPIVLAGRTGAGKTIVLQRLENAIDLEGLAHHRGSAFGRHATPQPTQINFENQLSMALMRFIETPSRNLIIEDEGRNIGSVSMSGDLFSALKSGPRVVVETPLAERIEITHQEYVLQAQTEYSNLADWVDFMRSAIERIHKRLGGERHQRVLKAFEAALQLQQQTGATDGHRRWIEILLSEYYDPMYDYQMSKNDSPVIFQGGIDEVVRFLQTYQPNKELA
ncbi:MAG: tRNA 2-selenouridine(34) synthase MnmH [Pseudomonadota bacterium]